MSQLDQQLQQAAMHLQAKRLPQAEAACRAVLSVQPAHADALHLLGLVRKQSGDLVEAEKLMRLSIQAAPKRADFHANLGNVLQANRSPQQARDAYLTAVALDAHHALARLGLARSHLELGELAEAEAACRTLLEQRPKDAQAWSTLASVLRRAGSLNEAERAYRRALELLPNYALAHHNLGSLLADLDRAEEALESLNRAHALGVVTWESALNRGNALLKLYRLQEAEQAYLEAVKLQPRSIEAHRNLARLRFMAGDPKFDRSVAEALAIYGQDIGLYMLRAELARDSGDLAQAESILRSALQSVGESAAISCALSGVLLQLGRMEEAEQEARKAAASDQHPSIIENLVSVLLMRGRAPEALEWIEKVRGDAPREQRWIAYEASAARMLNQSRYEQLYDFDRFVRTYEVEAPAGWRSIAEFNAELEQVLRARHQFMQHPLDQSLRHGSQTARSLLADADPLIKAILKQFDAPLAEYAASIGNDLAHPLTTRNRSMPVIDKCWSVQLRAQGFHVNHIHPQGWISSAYYVAVPEETQDLAAVSGWIKFGEPKLPIPRATPERQIQPASGKLVLFPSYMWHGTTPIHGASPRTTIAFDALPCDEVTR